MRLQPQLYVDTSGNPLGEPTFERLELFDFESIEITSTIQDFRDIGKIFTDYSKTFNVPASRTNNKIFKHYYNSSIVDGFDARIKQKAEIHINGILFRTGYIRLTKSLVSNGRPTSYSVTFFGSLTSLKNVIGDSYLADLSSLNKYNHSYDTSNSAGINEGLNNVYNGFTEGLELSTDSNGEYEMIMGTNRDIIYPAISASDKWFYNSDAETDPQTYNQGVSRNIYSDNDDTYGISYLTLKPAIKVRHIIDAIQEKYSSINFSGNFFATQGFDDLYMLLHNNKGVLAPASDSTDVAFSTYRLIGDFNDFNLDTSDPSYSTAEVRPITTKWRDYQGQKQVKQWHVIVKMTNTSGTGDKKHSIHLLEGNTAIDKAIDVEGDNEFTFVLCTDEVKQWDDLSVRVESTGGNLTSFKMDVELKYVEYKLKTYDEQTFQFYTPEEMCNVATFTAINGDSPTETSTHYNLLEGRLQTLVKNIEITRNIPKMKVLDFLQGIFKMFNLTAVPQEDDSLLIQPLNEFYSSGNTIDITNKVNTEEIGVNRMDLFKNIEFKFADPKTFGTINNNEVLNTNFGDLDYQATVNGTDSNLIFDGKDYKIKLPFEKMYFERLSDENNGNNISFGNGWLVDKDQNEILTKPILFYNVVQAVDSSVDKIGFLDKGVITQYNRPSNSVEYQYYEHDGTNPLGTAIQSSRSINFNTEFDEFTRLEVTESLFRIYYENYISSVFNKGTRVFDIEMKSDLAFLLKYNINDTLTIKGEEFLINNIKTNLSTGITNLELILKFFIEDVECVLGEDLTEVDGLALLLPRPNSLIIAWQQNDANELVAGYNIYVDGVLHSTTVGVGNGFEITGLDNDTEYTVGVKAYNCLGGESSSMTTVDMTTGDRVESIPPSEFTVTMTNRGSSSVDIEWTESIDDVGVTGYDVYLDGARIVQDTTIREATISLSDYDNHTVYVVAKDTDENTTQSNEISVRLIQIIIDPIEDPL